MSEIFSDFISFMEDWKSFTTLCDKVVSNGKYPEIGNDLLRLEPLILKVTNKYNAILSMLILPPNERYHNYDQLSKEKQIDICLKNRYLSGFDENMIKENNDVLVFFASKFSLMYILSDIKDNIKGLEKSGLSNYLKDKKLNEILYTDPFLYYISNIQKLLLKLINNQVVDCNILYKFPTIDNGYLGIDILSSPKNCLTFLDKMRSLYSSIEQRLEALFPNNIESKNEREHILQIANNILIQANNIVTNIQRLDKEDIYDIDIKKLVLLHWRLKQIDKNII